MASWKKVHVEDANTVHGTITATLSDNTTDLDASNLTAELVVSDGTAGGTNELKTRTISLGTAAFSDATDFATSSQGGDADTAVQPADFQKDLVAGDGIAAISADNVLYGSTDEDVTISVDIASLSDGSSSVAAGDFVMVYDASEASLVKVSVDDLTTAGGAGVTSVTAGDGLTGDATTGAITIDIDAAQTEITSIFNTSLEVGHSESGANIDFSTDNQIDFDIDGTSQIKLTDGALLPTADNDVDLGSASLRFKDLYIAGDLTVDGSTSTIDTINLNVEDRFISLNHDNGSNVDTGIVFEGADNKVFAWDETEGRFGVAYSGGDASVDSGGFSPNSWVTTVHSANGDSSNATAALAQIGNVYINASGGAGDGDIYIYS